MSLHDIVSNPFARTVILVPVSLLPILNPIANVPFFVTMLGEADDRTVRYVSRLVATYCFVMIVAAILLGAHVLGFFGVSLPIVRIGGGLLVAASGWRLMGDRDADSVRPQFAAAYGTTPARASLVATDQETARPARPPATDAAPVPLQPCAMSEDELRARAFYPISFPLTVGPGTLSASIAIGTTTPARALDWIVSVGGIAVGSAVTAIAVFLSYRYSGWLVRKLGALGTVILRRLSAFILLCIGVELMWDGIEGLLSQAAFMHAARA
jgi:multiple antibiotic resistance protein